MQNRTWRTLHPKVAKCYHEMARRKRILKTENPDRLERDIVVDRRRGAAAAGRGRARGFHGSLPAEGLALAAAREAAVVAAFPAAAAAVQQREFAAETVQHDVRRLALVAVLVGVLTRLE